MSGRGPEGEAADPGAAEEEPTGPAESADRWYDDEAGPVVRLFSMTRGRTRPANDGYFDLISMISAKSAADRDPELPEPVLDPEHRAILDLCADGPLSVAELGSYTDLPVSVVRVLLGDLDDAELIDVTRPVPLAELPDERLLREVINGLRAL
ncbi:DUF742 domain-containing protein [Kitasatospora sp. NPDC058965]|uniref:DUF742 domain-containing protein n=1 Tax=Kitasatospora sp. NPDC058965 TaxID=3346682 RepID=UPI00368DCDE5